MHRRLTALALATIALFGLTACTGAPAATPSSSSSGAAQTGGGGDAGGDGQTVGEACALIQDTIAGATGEFESAASADPAAIVEAMKTAASQVAEAASQVTNEEVAALLPSLQEMLTQTSELMQALVDGDVSKLGEMSEIGESFQETTERFQELCAS